jgi:hypothetical protein
MTLPRWSLALASIAAAAASIGCGKGGATATAPSGSPDGAEKAFVALPSSNSGATSGQATSASTPAKSSAPSTAHQEAPQTATVPAALMHDAYRYMGLGVSDPVKMTVTRSDTGTVSSSEQTTTLKSVRKGVALYVQDVTVGQIPTMEVEYTVKKDGVYARQLGGGANEQPKLQLPAVVTPGKTWKVTEKYVAGSTKMTMVTVTRIVGFEQVKTARGELQALVLDATGTETQSGKTAPVEMKTWLVKDIGAVRTEMTMRTPDSSKTVKMVSEIQ